MEGPIPKRAVAVGQRAECNARGISLGRANVTFDMVRLVKIVPNLLERRPKFLAQLLGSFIRFIGQPRAFDLQLMYGPGLTVDAEGE